MKYYLRITILTLIIMLMSIANVYAANLTVTLQPNKTEAKVDDEITVNLVVKNETGIDGLDSTLTYNKTSLNLIEIKPGNNFSDLSGENSATGAYNLSFLYNGSEVKKDVTVATLKFKVLSGLKVGDKLDINLSSIQVNTSDDEWITGNNQKLTITIVGENNQGGNENETPGGITPEQNTPEDNTPEQNIPEDNNQTGNDQTENKPTENKPDSITQENNNSVKKDTTVSDKPEPYAGIKEISFSILVIVAFVGIISFIKYKKYQNI